ncbi:MAG: DUF6528 family protein [Ginsengibacter sp.]
MFIKTLKRYTACFTFLIICTNAFTQKIINKSFLVCGDSKVLLADYNGSEDTIPKIIWQWDAHFAKDLPEEYRLKKFNSLDDCKAVNNGKRILVSSSSGAIGIIDRSSKKILFYASVPNAHSIELLPNGFLAAAASTARDGNKVLLFKISKPSEALFSDSLHSAHGLVWENGRKGLFALGSDVLREYQFIVEPRAKLLLKDEWKLPHKGGHDLQMRPKNNKLFLTIENAGAWEFNLNSHLFSKIKDFTDAKIIKSIGQNISGQYIFTIPEESWWTYHVEFSNPERLFAFPDMHVYKARWFD